MLTPLELISDTLEDEDYLLYPEKRTGGQS